MMWWRLRALGLVCGLAGSALVLAPLPAGHALAAQRVPARNLASGAVLRDPSAVAVTSSGDYFVADAGHSRVVHYDSKGNYLGSIGQPASRHPQPAKGDLSFPTGVALDGKGNLYVADL